MVARLAGELPLPWEEMSPLIVRQLGVLKGPVLKLLQREPSDRISMDRFHALCGKVFSGQSADAAVRPDTNAPQPDELPIRAIPGLISSQQCAEFSQEK